MKGILIAGVFAAFAITVIDSLNCMQCFPSTDNCPTDETDCDNKKFISCVESSVNSTLGESPYLYENKFCSEDKCTTVNNTEVSFIVYVSDNKQFSFASKCCEEGACPDDNSEKDPVENSKSARADIQIQCPSCYSSNTTDCKEEIRQCSQGQQCVHIIADHVNGTVHNKVELKGCSNIDEATCHILTPGNVTVGEFTFQTVSCTNETTTTTPTTVTTTPSTTTPSTSTSLKASFISSVFGSLLLLKLLF